MSNVSSNYSASLGDFVRLSGSTVRSEGNYCLEKNEKGGFILGIDNHHRHITVINRGKGMSGSKAEKANNRNINLDFYKAFCAFVNASKFKRLDSVQNVLARAKGELLRRKLAEGEKSAYEGLDTPLERRTVRRLMADLKNAIKSEFKSKFEKEHPLYNVQINDVLGSIDDLKCGAGGFGGFFSGLFGSQPDESKFFLTLVQDISPNEVFDKVDSADKTTVADNKMIRTHLSGALEKLAQDILKENNLTRKVADDIKAIREKAKDLTSEANIGKALSVKDAKSLSEYYYDMVGKYLPRNETTRKNAAYSGGLIGPTVRSEYEELQTYAGEIARIENLNDEESHVVPPSPEFTSSLKGVLGRTSLTLNAEQAGNALLSPILGYLKTYTSAFVGGMELKTNANGLLTLKLKDIVAKDEIYKFALEKMANPDDANIADDVKTKADLAKNMLGDLEELTISIVPKIVNEPIRGDESDPPKTHPVLRLEFPKSGLWSVKRGGEVDYSLANMVSGLLSAMAVAGAVGKFVGKNKKEEIDLEKMVNPEKAFGYTTGDDVNITTVDVDLSALKIDALAEFGLSAADLTSLKVGANGVQFGFCEPAGHRPANPQPGAGAAGFNAPHSLEAEIGTADLVTNAKTLVREHLTKKQEGLAHDSPEWQTLENRKGLLNDLGTLSLTTNPADETITVGANGMQLDSNLGRLEGTARDLVDLLKPRSLSVKLKPQIETPGKLSAEIKDFSFTAAGDTFKASLLSWALKFKPLRKFGFWLFKDKITAGVRNSFGPGATISMQDNGWPKVVLPIGTFTQGILGGATDVGAALSEIKVTSRGVKFGVDVEHVVRNPIVSGTNGDEAALMADMRVILGKQQNAITQEDVQALRRGWDRLVEMKTRIGALIAAANRRRNASKVNPMSHVDALVALKQIEDDIKEFETKRAVLGINGPWRQA